MSDRIKSWEHFQYNIGHYEPQWDDDPKDFKPYEPVKNKLIWNVFNEENNKIVPINLFDYNWVFLKRLCEIKKQYKEFNPFAEHVRLALMSSFGSRAEYETIITSWPPYISNEELERLNKEQAEYEAKWGPKYNTTINISPAFKIDVYTQIMLNWDRFIDYLWTNRNLISKEDFGIEKL